MIGFGTKPGTAQSVIQNAIDVGYTFIDSKDSNESLSCFKSLSFDRSKLCISSKLMGEHSPENHKPQNVRKECLKSLEKAGLRYWDIYYIHTTHAFNNVPILETYKELLSLKAEKLCLHVGLSNITYEQLQAIIRNTTKPDYIQIEIHPYLVENRMVELCKINDIKIVAHSPFGSSLWKEISKNTVLLELANKYSMSVAQLVLNWHISRGIIPIPSSNNKSHIESNLKNIKLSSEDVQAITALNKNQRVFIKPNHYETIGNICTPLPKRIINMNDVINDTSVQSTILNDIVIKGFYVGSTSVDPQLHEICTKLNAPNDGLLNKIKSNPFITSIATNYYNKTLNTCEVRTNVPNKNLRPYLTELFHRDSQLQKCLKIIIYLSDVGKDNGPLQIVYPEPDVNLRWYKDRNARTPPEEIYQNIPHQNIVSIEGPAYTMIIFEGTVLHCGGFVTKGFRKIVYLE